MKMRGTCMVIVISLSLAREGYSVCIFSEVVISHVLLCKCGLLEGLCLETVAGDSRFK
jgi:hypothetical protein